MNQSPILPKWCIAPVTLLLLASAVAAETIHHPLQYDFASFRAAMEDPARAQWQQPDEIVSRLKLRRGQRVADVGAGTGYFTVRLARAVGPRGRVYAADIDRRAVRYMRRRFQREKLPQISVIEAKPADPKLPGRVDLIFICDVWHHIEDRAAYLHTLRRYLAKNGRIAIVEFKPDANPAIGPPKEMRLSAELVGEELRRAGFEIEPLPDFLPLQYVLTATLAPAGEPHH
jgi:ubiquinone/menaquinone biosynthesis C-methylase UbiE